MISSDSINWESKYIFYTGTLTSVCWSPELSLFVAVGTSGRIITSIDGNIWITRSSSGNNWSSICWSSSLNLFVIIANTGTYRISTSPDGITWTSQTSFTNTSNWSSIVWASGLSLFVAVANSGITTTQIATSPNGTTWTLQTSPVANTWTSISYSSSLNLLVAVSNSGTGNRVMTSSNGILWTSRISAADNNWTSICWASGLSLFIAIANNGTNTRMMKSSNGTSWTLIDTTNLNIDYNVIIYSSNLNLLIAGGISSGLYSNNKIVTSSDSNIWILRDTNYDGWNKILWIPSLNSYIGCASSNGYMKRIIKSSNGIDWSLFSTNIINDYNSYLIQDIIFVSELNLFIGIGNTFIIYSSNADFWSNCLLPSGTLNLRSIIWSSSLNLLVAVGNSGTMASRILTSSDGINWTLQTHPLLTGSWYSITWSSSLNLFAIVSYSNYYNQVITSPDGINWTLRTTSSNAFILSSITWISQLNLFIATSNNSYILKSSDGITWTSSIIYTNEGIALSSIVNQLLWINKYNILVGISINDNSQNTLVYTYDTITWYTITLPYFNNNSYSSIVYSNELEQFIVYTNSSTNSFGDKTLQSKIAGYVYKLPKYENVVIVDNGGGGITKIPEISALSTYVTEDSFDEFSVNSSLESLGILGPIQITNGGAGYVVNDKIIFTGGSGNGPYANVASVDASGAITSVDYFIDPEYRTYPKWPLGGMGYKNQFLPSLSIVSSNAQATGASLYVPGILGTGAIFSPVVDRAGSVTTITIQNYGEDYEFKPNVSIRIQDIAVSNVAIENLPALLVITVSRVVKLVTLASTMGICVALSFKKPVLFSFF